MHATPAPKSLRADRDEGSRSSVIGALGSVFPQLAPGDEVVVATDGSTDGTVEAVRARLVAEWPLGRVLDLPPKGVSAARNEAAAETSIPVRSVGRYIFKECGATPKLKQQRSTQLAAGPSSLLYAQGANALATAPIRQVKMLPKILSTS